MRVEDTHIYFILKRHIGNFVIKQVPKGKVFSRALDNDKTIYYIISGEVKVEGISVNGKKILVDYISENEFAGHISCIRKSNFYCDSIAATNVNLLCLDYELMERLLKDPEFSTFFYYKTSARLYIMYKKMLMSNFFNQNEIVAYYLLEQSQNNIIVFKSVYDICAQMNISRRNYYNILKKLLHGGVLVKLEDGQYQIDDIAYLEEMSVKVKMFLDNSM